MPNALATSTFPARHACTRPWNPQSRIRPHLEGVAEVVVETAKDRVHGPQTRDGLQEDALVAHRQVAALDEGKTKLPGKVGMLEVGLVVRPGGQHATCGAPPFIGAPANRSCRSSWKNDDNARTRIA